MSNPWFRMYSEFASDPKVQMLTEAMQRRYVMLMCLRCSNALVTLHETEIAFALRISEEELQSTKTLFVAKKFIDEGWNLLNWEKRQFSSDSSAARVAEHRKRKKEAEEAARNGDVTLQKRKANALDTEQKRTEKTIPPGFSTFWITWPKSDRKEGKGKCLEAWDKQGCESIAEQIIAHVTGKKASAGWTKNGGEYIPAPLVYLNGRKWEGAEIESAAKQESFV